MSYRHNFEKFDSYTKVQVESFVKMKISTNKNWALRALIKLYEFQSKNERQNHISVNKDNYGFSKFDAPYFSDLAAKVKQGKNLTKNQIKSLKKLSKYSRQLISICNRTKMQSALDKYYGNVHAID